MHDLVYSFDVFDTCLVRIVARPTDLFYKVFQQVFSNQNIFVESETLAELVRHRIVAEQTARIYLKEREDLSIYDVYQHFDLQQWSLDTKSVIETELLIERQSTKPILATKRLIDKLRREEQRIVFISDMYLPKREIQKMLIEYKLAEVGDSIYVSSEVGLTKSTGNLFRHVLKCEAIQPRQLCHYGDNIYSDVVIPKTLGIQATHFKLSQLSRYEKSILVNSDNEPQIRSQLAGVSRLTRLNNEISAGYADDLLKVIAGIVAPLLTSYVAWVIQEANKAGIERLYFVSRDGQILLKIAQQLAQYISVPSCRYLHGSRQAWFLPSLKQVSRKHLDWLVLNQHSTSLRDLLGKLSIKPDEISAVLTQFGFDLSTADQQLSTEAIERFWQVIENPEVTHLIFQNATSTRSIAASYFVQEGLCDSVKWALVDIGWTLKCHRALRRVLQHLNQDNQVRGYYFGVLRECLTVAEVGDYRAFLKQDIAPGHPLTETEHVFRNISLIEHVFTLADHPTVVGYTDSEGQVIPVFKNEQSDQDRIVFVDNIHKVIMAYVNELARTGLLSSNIDVLKRLAVKSTIEFLSHPDESSVRSIAHLPTGYDQNESRLRPLARPITVWDTAYLAARVAKLIPPRDFNSGFSWLEGSIALSNPLIKFLFFLFTTSWKCVSIYQPVWLYRLRFQIMANRK